MLFHRLRLLVHWSYTSIKRRMLAFMNARSCILVVKSLRGSNSKYPLVCIFINIGL